MPIHDKVPRELVNALTKQLLAEGKLIEGGWEGLWTLLEPEFGKVDGAKENLRQAFFAGADHLFSTILSVMDEDREPTEADLKVMDQISAELKAWREKLIAKYGIET